MAHKKRPSKRKASPSKKRSTAQNDKPLQITGALDGLPKPARAIVARVDAFKAQYPKLYEVITRDVDSPYYRNEVERRIEREQKKRRQ